MAWLAGLALPRVRGVLDVVRKVTSADRAVVALATAEGRLVPRAVRGGEVELETTLPTIEADRSQMQQLLLNLVGNALKFHKPERGSHVRVRASETMHADEPAILLEVEDDGIGFDEKYRDKVFGPFQRLHGRTAYEGTGIGLAICERIVERHRGKIDVRSAPDVGSKFTVVLPTTQPPADKADDAA